MLRPGADDARGNVCATWRSRGRTERRWQCLWARVQTSVFSTASERSKAQGLQPHIGKIAVLVVLPSRIDQLVHARAHIYRWLITEWDVGQAVPLRSGGLCNFKHTTRNG